MDVLTRPCSIAAWAPVPFEIKSLATDRLETGSHARVAGRLAGKELEFAVDVQNASPDTLRLTASGPFVELDVTYDISTLDEWAQVTASIDVKGKGVLGRFVAKAVEGLLAGGALDHALARLAKTVETGHDSEYELVALAA